MVKGSTASLVVLILLATVPGGMVPRLDAQGTGPILTFTPVQYPADADLSAVIDFNSDGQPDLINVYDNCPALVAARANAGGRDFGGGPFFENLSCGPYPFPSIAVADVDADGDGDFLYLDANNNTIGAIAADGTGGLRPPVITPLGEPSADFAVADMDGNGLTDLVVTEPTANAVVVLSGDGTGRFRFFAFARGGGEPGEVGTGDVDGDGDIDVLTINRTQQTLSTFLNDGSGRLTHVGDRALGGIPAAVAVADLNRDDRADVVVSRVDPAVAVFVADGGGTVFAAVRLVAATRIVPAQTSGRAPVVADVNEDGFPDVALGFSHPGPTKSVSVLYGDGTGALSEPESFAGGAPVDSADLDADGRLDLVGEGMLVFWNGAAAGNRPPQANAGDDVVVPEGGQSEVVLDAWRSVDPDGHALTYTWTDAAGGEVDRIRRIQPLSLPRAPGTYQFTLTVDDLHGGRSTDHVTVTVQPESTGGQNPSGPVVWTGTVNVATSGASVTKNSGCDGCADAGAVSEQQIANGGWFEFVPTFGGRMYAGVNGENWTTTAASAIGHAFSFWPDGGWDIREFGQYRTDGRFVQGDVFRIVVDDFEVLYYRNNTLLYRSRSAPRLPARADTSFLSAGSRIENAVVEVGPN